MTSKTPDEPSSPGGAVPGTTRGASGGRAEVPDTQVYRSPVALVIWWVWVLFAAANLIDLAVQGRDHLALVAAFSLLLLTGFAYVAALRPRVIAGPAELTVVNPLAAHRVGWAAVAAAEAGELLRVRCEWPEGDTTRQRVIYAWAVHSSGRRRLAAELRAQRQARRGPGGGPGSAGFGSFARSTVPAAGDEPDPLRLDPARVVAALTERAEQARTAAPTGAASPGPAAAPASAWSWTAVALVLVPAVALLAVGLA